jgi:hypothetical protein
MLRCTSPDVTICEVSPCAVDVWKVGYNGLDLLTLSSSRFDPRSKSVEDLSTRILRCRLRSDLLKAAN